MLMRDFSAIMSEKIKYLPKDPDPQKDILSKITTDVILQKLDWLLACYAKSEKEASSENLQPFCYFIEDHWDRNDKLLDIRCRILAKQLQGLVESIPYEEALLPKKPLITHWISKPVENPADLALCKLWFGTEINRLSERKGGGGEVLYEGERVS